jgi:pimeloyl-ACP methyl ester carboxylesterase
VVKLLFVHGSGGGKEEWLYQTRHFADSEAVALPGHPEGKPCSSVDDYMEWLRDYILQHKYQDVVIAGHSLGGAIGMLYGLRYGNEAKALVLIGTGARLRVLPSFLASVEAMITDHTAWEEYVRGRYSRVDEEDRQVLARARIGIGPAVMLSDLLCCDRFDIMGEVHAIRVPTLVVCGNEDELAPVKYAHYLTNNIAGATEVIVDGAGHFAFAEKPTEVNQAIEKFLGGLD